MDVETQALNSSRNDSIAPQLVKEVKKASKKRKYVAIFGLVGIVLLTLAAVGIYYLVQSSRYSDRDAAKDVDDSVMDVVINYNKTHDFVITPEQEKTLEKAFNHFDSNNDGYLDMKEYRHYFSSKRGFDFSFNHVDVDNDTINSYKELIFYYYSMCQVSPVFAKYYKNIYSHAVNKVFNYNYTSVDDQLWYEYAVSIFMKNYDTTQKGYLTKQDLILGLSSDLFLSIDSNNDNLVDFNEFENANMNEDGIKHRVDNNFGSNSNEISNINVKVDDITNLELTTCLTDNYQKLQDVDIRRLIQACVEFCPGNGACTFLYRFIDVPVEDADGNVIGTRTVFVYFTDCDVCDITLVENDEECP